jgi:membrane protease YdiL (CAAX protease family)
MPAGAPAARPILTERIVAALEVIICSDYPTQFALAATFAAFGFRPQVDGTLSLGYVAALSISDTLFLTSLIVFFLLARGERPREVFLGDRPLLPELWAGVPLLFAAFGIALLILLGVQVAAPWLHTVERNPFEDFARTPAQAALFALVVIVAGGIREEVQRAFLLRRFECWLGGARVGLIVTSAVFGAGHIFQGWDAALVTGVLGAFWGAVYLRRRSIGAPMVSHAGFDLIQVLRVLMLGR